MINEGNILTGYTYELAANQRVKVNTVGDTIACYAATADFEIEVGSNKAPMKRGMVFRSNYFTQGVSIINGATAQTITIYIGDGDIDLPIPNVVEVIDGDRQISIDGRAFMGLANQAPVASEYGHVQLINPSANAGRLCRLTKITASLDAAGSLTLGLLNTNLSTLTASGNLGNKDTSSSIASTMEMRQQTDPTILTTAGRAIVNLASADPHVFELEEPFILYPGYGLVVCAGQPNVRLRVSYQFVEEVY